MKEVVYSKLCELCNDQAALFCTSDSAFLCFNCDAKVHQANFLVARHLRFTLCSHCNSLTKNRFSPCSHSLNSSALCSSCSPRNFSAHDSDLHSLSSSSSSTCVSSTHSCATTQKQISSSDQKLLDSSNSANSYSGEVINSAIACPKYEARSRNVKLRDPMAATGVFMHWCTKLGMCGEEGAVVLQTACGALGICLGRFRALPLRVGLVASLWFGLKSSGDRSKSTRRYLKRLEEISGVPAKLILAYELKLRQIVKTDKQRQRQGMEESWGESSA
ncbi:PREDICTED: B-box zinc finger protein 32 [Nicotiana attenuata]|uniref:B-box zinc finger protein 32 n=1 Tax=Nicotiana attenuata TaxID=49451 RepID=A0A1J6KA27_NICAT|nr:PREDICTED: B-box zinc finger protein 32 [Nicotiana attenuata]OIT26893.1 b-box zinc finger protein 32 [Nicotiana attenuata]